MSILKRSKLAAAVLAVLALGAAAATIAQGERSQEGNLVASLDGGLSPLRLPRDHPAPVAVHLEGGLYTNDGSLLPRVTGMELRLPGQGKLTTRGLPLCSLKRLRNAPPNAARKACKPALIGQGSLEAYVLIPNQPPFSIHARLLAFNGRIQGRRAVILHAFAADPPTVVVLPFILRLHSGRSATTLAASLPPSLGPWPHFAKFQMTLSRRYRYRGRNLSYLSASCPAPRQATAGFFSLARATYVLAEGGRISTGIIRGCRAR